VSKIGEDTKSFARPGGVGRSLNFKDVFSLINTSSFVRGIDSKSDKLIEKREL